MLINFLIFVIFTILIVLSTLGYGLIFANKLFKKSEYLSLPLKGIFGIFFIYIISTLTHLVVPHNYAHNSIVLIIGILLFYEFYRKGLIENKQLKTISYVFLFLVLCLIIR